MNDWNVFQQQFGDKMKISFIMFLERELNETISRLAAENAHVPKEDLDKKVNEWHREFVNFRQRTRPIFENSDFRGVFRKVNACGSFDQIWQRAVKHFGPTVVFMMGGPGSGKS